MAKTASLNIRIDPEIKFDAEKLFSRFGITVTDAVNIFLHQSLMIGGLPFEMKQPKAAYSIADDLLRAKEARANGYIGRTAEDVIAEMEKIIAGTEKGE